MKPSPLTPSPSWSSRLSCVSIAGILVFMFTTVRLDFSSACFVTAQAPPSQNISHSRTLLGDTRSVGKFVAVAMHPQTDESEQNAASDTESLSDDQLSERMLAVLESKCTMCHDERGSSAGGGVDNLLDLESLVDGYVDLDSPEESYLIELLIGESPRMPFQRMGKISGAGPLSKDEQAIVIEWVNRGAPFSEDEVVDRQVISLEAIRRIASDDLGDLPPIDARFARYIDLTNAHNDREVTERQLELFRAAMVKTLNSLSASSEILGLDTSNAVQRVRFLNPERTLFAFDLRHIGWEPSDWSRVSATYPFALRPSTSADRLLMGPDNYSMVLRADWFVFATLQAPLYHELVGIPQNLSTLERALGVDRAKAIRNRQVARAGMEDSRVSVNNRLLERISLSNRSGAYHISYDFASNNGEQNLFTHPLGPIETLDMGKEFRHDGGEVIFNLPNGMQAYALVDATGSRLDIAPQAIVSDPSMPGSFIINGISCISCHRIGMKPESDRLDTLDQVKPSVASNRLAFTTEQTEAIDAMYPDHATFARLLELDRDRFLDSLQKSGVDPDLPVEPVRALFDYFVRDLNTTGLAADLGLEESDLVSRFEREGAAREILQRSQRGTMKRRFAMEAFAKVARLAGIGDQHPFIAASYPFFGSVSNPTSPAESNATSGLTNEANYQANGQIADYELPGNIGIELFDLENPGGRLQVRMWTEGNLRSFREGEEIKLRLRSTEDCFVTLAVLDSEQNAFILVPNDSQPQLQLRAGRTETIPTDAMLADGLALVVEPPHGFTVVKAIVSKRPLQFQTKPAEVFANAKSIRLRQRPSASTNDPPRPETSPNQRPGILTSSSIIEQFSSAEFGTATLVLKTHP